MGSRRQLAGLVALVAAAVLAEPARASDVQSAELTAQLSLKLFAYDRTLRGASKEPFRLLVLTRGDSALESAFRAHDGKMLHKRWIRIEVVRLEEGTDLAAELTRVDAVFLASDASAYAPRLAKLCVRSKIRSITNHEASVRAGLGIGVRIEAGKPKITINRPVVTAVGMQLSSRLLALSTIIE